MKRTKAQRRLCQFLRSQEWTQSKLAAALGVDQSSISRIARGLSRPDPVLRKAIRFLLGIPEDEWLTAKELEVVARLKDRHERLAKTGTDA